MPYSTDELRNLFHSLSQEEIAGGNRRDHEEHLRQVTAFRGAYAKGHCYLCHAPFDQMRKAQPCSHWLLRRCHFKKADFAAVFERYDYHNIAAFLRWCANEETHLRNINDLVEERSKRKILSYTIKWKNIEWTFDCTENDLSGHGRSHSSRPHYHFQMRIDQRQFIKFSDFHVPFSERDLFNLSLRHEPWFHQGFGSAGSGMQDAMSVDIDRILEFTEPTSDTDIAPYHFSTIIEAIGTPLSGEEIHSIIEESKKTRKSFAYVAQTRLRGRASVETTISPSDDVPDIAARTESKRR